MGLRENNTWSDVMKKLVVTISIIVIIGGIYLIDYNKGQDLTRDKIAENELEEDVGNQMLHPENNNKDSKQKDSSPIELKDETERNQELNNEEDKEKIAEQMNTENNNKTRDNPVVVDDKAATSKQEKENNEDIENKEEEHKTQEKESTKQETNGDENIVYTETKIEDVQNNISLEDKAKAVKLIFAKLKASDISLLKGLVTGGLTPEEKEKAKEIAYARFSEEELEIIKELYKKYMN